MPPPGRLQAIFPDQTDLRGDPLRRDNRFAGDRHVFSFGRLRNLATVPERCSTDQNCFNHPFEFSGLERRRVVWAGARWIKCQMLFNCVRLPCNGRDRNIDAKRMIRISDVEPEL